MKRESITAEELQKLMKDYNIGKKPLAKLLGWGETAIIRYSGGEVPTAEYAKKLRAIQESPAYYFSLLNEGREKISEVAFKKSSTALEAILTSGRLDTVAQYIVGKASQDISFSRLQTILYYSQGFSLAIRKKELFPDEYNVPAKGFMPYPSLLWKKSELYDKTRVISCKSLIEEEKELIDSISGILAWFGPEPLRLLTLNERAILLRGTARGIDRSIKNQNLCSFFEKLSERYGISKPEKAYIYFNKRILELRKKSAY